MLALRTDYIKHQLPENYLILRRIQKHKTTNHHTVLRGNSKGDPEETQEPKVVLLQGTVLDLWLPLLPLDLGAAPSSPYQFLSLGLGGWSSSLIFIPLLIINLV